MKSEPRALARGALESDSSSLGFRDLARDGESETGPSCLGGEERSNSRVSVLPAAVFDGEPASSRFLAEESMDPPSPTLQRRWRRSENLAGGIGSARTFAPQGRRRRRHLGRQKTAGQPFHPGHDLSGVDLDDLRSEGP
jgi:hypothetical protein